MKKIILNNYRQKLIALAIALGVWLYVYAEHHPRFFATYDVKITYAHLEKKFTVDSAPDAIVVRMKGNPQDIADINPNNITAEADLSGLGPGTHEVKVSVRHSSLAEVASRNLKVVVRLKKLNSIQLPVDVTLSGSLPIGKTPGIPKPEPGVVTFYGHEPALNKVAKASANVYLTGQDDAFSVDLRVTPLDNDGKPINGITADPPEITVEVPVYNATARTKPVMLVYSGRLSDAQKTIVPEIDPPTVTIFGEEKALNALNVVHTEKFDANRCLKGETFKARLTPPKPLVASPSEVTITCRIPKIVQRKFTVNVDGMYLGEGLRAAIEPDKIEVTIEGESTLVNKLGLADFTATVDLSGKGAGSYSMTPVASLINGEAGAVTFKPAPQVKVVITKR